MDVIYGIHPVEEAIESRPRAVEYVAVARDRRDAKIEHIVELCRQAGISLRLLNREELRRLAHTDSHQGVAAVTAARSYAALEDLINVRRDRHAFLLVLDGVEDPHNLGAILRTADGAGADGVIIPERRSVGVNATVAKVAAGAAESMPIARVTNTTRTLEALKRQNIWTVGLDERGTQAYDELDYNMDCALVMGGEGIGLHDLVRKNCDFLISIPMLGKVPSLNVSVAAAVVMYELARQRRRKA